MGLDYGLVRVNRDDLAECKDSNKLWKLWTDDAELAYGRKSWELVHMFRTDLGNDCCSKLEPEDWDKFIASVNDFGYDNLVKARYEYSDLDRFYVENYYVNDSVEPEYPDICKEYEKWYDKVFDETPTLGYDFSVGYMLSFYEANDKVRQAWEDGDEVWTFASY